MLKQYQLELKYFKLILKSKLISQGALRISFIENGNESVSINAEQEQFKIPFNRSVIELGQLNSIKANINKQVHDLSLRYQIKGKSTQRVRNLQINVQNMIEQLQKNSTDTFEEKVSGAKDDVIYVLTLTALTNNQKQQSLQNQKLSYESKTQVIKDVSLNLNDANLLDPRQGLKNRLGSLMINTSRQQVISKSRTAPHEESQINQKQRHLNQQSSITPVITPIMLQKKTSSLPLSEIQKINQLMNYQAFHSQPDHGSFKLSIKLKIVIVLFMLGVIFLLLDTFNDFTGRRKRVYSRMRARKAKEAHAASQRQKAFHEFQKEYQDKINKVLKNQERNSHVKKTNEQKQEQHIDQFSHKKGAKKTK